MHSPTKQAEQGKDSDDYDQLEVPFLKEMSKAGKRTADKQSQDKVRAAVDHASIVPAAVWLGICIVRWKASKQPETPNRLVPTDLLVISGSKLTSSMSMWFCSCWQVWQV